MEPHRKRMHAIIESAAKNRNKGSKWDIQIIEKEKVPTKRKIEHPIHDC